VRIRGAEGVKQIVHAIRKSEGAAPCERVGRWDGGEQEPSRGIPAERGKESSSSSQRPNSGEKSRRSLGYHLLGESPRGFCWRTEAMGWSVVCWWVVWQK
jgi:hypothetical protein